MRFTEIYVGVTVAMGSFSSVVYLYASYIVAAAAFLYAAYSITHSAALLSFCTSADGLDAAPIIPHMRGQRQHFFKAKV